VHTLSSGRSNGNPHGRSRSSRFFCPLIHEPLKVESLALLLFEALAAEDVIPIPRAIALVCLS